MSNQERARKGNSYGIELVTIRAFACSPHDWYDSQVNQTFQQSHIAAPNKTRCGCPPNRRSGPTAPLTALLDVLRSCCHLLSRKRDSLRLTRLPVTHDTVIQDTAAAVDTIGRMTLADDETTAHQERTAHVRVTGREDRSSPCRNWHVDTLPVCAAVET